LLAIKEIQIKTTLQFHLILVKLSITKTQTTNVGEDESKKEPSYPAEGNVN
jgi:hypothetical protein